MRQGPGLDHKFHGDWLHCLQANRGATDTLAVLGAVAL